MASFVSSTGVDKEVDLMDVITKIDAVNTTVSLFNRIEWVESLLKIRDDMLWSFCRLMVYNPLATAAAVTAGILWWYRDQIIEQLGELTKRFNSSTPDLFSKVLETISVLQAQITYV